MGPNHRGHQVPEKPESRESCGPGEQMVSYQDVLDDHGLSGHAVLYAS